MLFFLKKRDGILIQWTKTLLPGAPGNERQALLPGAQALRPALDLGDLGRAVLGRPSLLGPAQLRLVLGRAMLGRWAPGESPAWHESSGRVGLGSPRVARLVLHL